MSDTSFKTWFDSGTLRSMLESAAGMRVFPILISWDAGKQKWTKRPMTSRGHKDASTDVTRFNWRGANGYGIAMGHGWYALDLDTHKGNVGDGIAAWFDRWQVTRETRTHRTVSGGLHYIYRTARPAWDRLQTRAAIVPGLDSRGDGGWIAFGEGYEVICDAPAALLSTDMCIEMSKGPRGGAIDLKPLEPIDEAATLRRLELVLTGKLRTRWKGRPDGLHDTSASGFDMSMAKLLAIKGFGYSQVYWIMTTHFAHGVVCSAIQ